MEVKMSTTGDERYEPEIVSIFSGCGGLDLGFHLEGYKTIEIWNPSVLLESGE